MRQLSGMTRLTEQEKIEHRREVQKRWNAKDSSKKIKHNYYLNNRVLIAKRNKKHNLDLKIEVLSHYSAGVPMCLVCGITDADVLTMHHINGNGNKHKQSLGGSLGKRLYLWLKKNGFPKGFQVLCFNCNFKKGLHG